MIADLHAHYPMHVIPREEADTHAAIRRLRERDRLQATLVDWISRWANYEGPTAGTPSVTMQLMRDGGVGVALSVLYRPHDEIDLARRYGAPPEPAYFAAIMRQLETVDADVLAQPGARTARTRAQIDEARAAGEIALVHCVEGGFALGATAHQIAANVPELRKAGVAYVTLAHLFFRGVATNAPALPFLADWMYRLLFRQDGRTGLTELGRAAVHAMVDARVLIDVTHMSRRALDDTFELLERRDPFHSVPVIASHIACRFGRLTYNASDETLRRIARRGGVVGVIACEHYMGDGIRRKAPATFDESLDVVYRHVDRVRDVTGSHDHVAIGSDLDGYIKPALHGLGHLGRMRALEEALVARYGAETANKICSGNALRVLDWWG